MLRILITPFTSVIPVPCHRKLEWRAKMAYESERADLEYHRKKVDFRLPNDGRVQQNRMLAVCEFGSIGGGR